MKYFLLLFLFPVTALAQSDSLINQLTRYKSLYEQGLIDSIEYKTIRNKALGIEQNNQTQTQPVTVILKEPVKATDTLNAIEANKLYRQGVSDAAKYFRTGGVFGGTFICTVFTGPVFGLIPAIACSSSAPKEDRFINDNNEPLFNNQYYAKGYKEQARKMKRGNAWAAWGVGIALNAVTGTVVGLVVRNKRK